jgi:hypothetical protein
MTAFMGFAYRPNSNFLVSIVPDVGENPEILDENEHSNPIICMKVLAWQTERQLFKEDAVAHSACEYTQGVGQDSFGHGTEILKIHYKKTP